MKITQKQLTIDLSTDDRYALNMTREILNKIYEDIDVDDAKELVDLCEITKCNIERIQMIISRDYSEKV